MGVLRHFVDHGPGFKGGSLAISVKKSLEAKTSRFLAQKDGENGQWGKSSIFLSKVFWGLGMQLFGCVSLRKNAFSYFPLQVSFQLITIIGKFEISLLTGMSANIKDECEIVVHNGNDETAWHALESADEVFRLLDCTPSGLTEEEAARRIEKYGPNRLTPPKKETFLRKLFRHINNVLIYILMVAAAFSIYFAIDDYEGDGGFSSWTEFGLIIGVIVINVLIGLIQEGKAEKAADAIKAMLSSKATVLRDGETYEIDAENVVPGDVVYLKSGNKVPADVRMISVNMLQVQEDILTGESCPVSKNLEAVSVKAGVGDRKCMAYSGTLVTTGEACVVVCETGDRTEIGRISNLVSNVEKVETNLQRQLHIVGLVIGACVVMIAIAAFFLGWQGPFGFVWQKAFKNSIATAVAIIPEGLPAVVTITLALGVSAMAKENAIIRQLPCVETLGSLTVICSDKTGTLTKSEMTSVALQSSSCRVDISGVGYEPKGEFTISGKGEIDERQKAFFAHLLLVGSLCSNSSLLETTNEKTGDTVWKASGNPTEVAIVVGARKLGLDPKALREEHERIASIPFESSHKFMATVNRVADGRAKIFVKGAADKLINLSADQLINDSVDQRGPIDTGFWHKQVKALSSKGLRVLALCEADVDISDDFSEISASYIIDRPKFLTIVGLVAILDPPREECIPSIEEAHKAGIVVKMITGDHADTALAIGIMLGIAEEGGVVYTGPQLDEMSEEQLKDIVQDCNIFARSSPENKIDIVKALQAIGEISSMTGDGVNDAPALKAANIGVAMGIAGTDVSKEAAQMVLADDNFTTILVAVKEGRRVWDNLRKILAFNLPCNFAQGLSVFFSLCFAGLGEVPLTVIQVLYINMITAVTMGLMLACEPAELDIMEKAPRRPGKRLFGKLIVWRILWVSTYMIIVVIGVFAWNETWPKNYDLEERRGETFTVLIFMEVAYSLNCRFLKKTALCKEILFGNKWSYLSIAVVCALQVLILYTPGLSSEIFEVSGLDGYQWLRVLCFSVGLFFFVELEKFLVDPVLFPMVKPFLKALGLISPPRHPDGRNMKGGVGERKSERYSVDSRRSVEMKSMDRRSKSIDRRMKSMDRKSRDSYQRMEETEILVEHEDPSENV